MTARWGPSHWPLSVKVPLLLTLLMVTVAAGISKAVLYRLTQTQQAHLRELSGAFLEGLATALQPAVIRRDSWEAFDVLDRARNRYSAVHAAVTLAVLPDGTVLAASDPMLHPIGAKAPVALVAAQPIPDLDDPSGEVWIRRDLHDAGIPLGTVAALVDVTRFQAVKRATLATLVGFNALLTLFLAVLGWTLVRRALHPLTRLSDLLARSSDGRLTMIPAADLPPADTEVGRAYRRYHAAATAVDEREALIKRLASEERAAVMGRYASALAHEVNNPLGGLFNAVRMIQRHGDDALQREKAARLIERGLTGIRNVVKASLERDPSCVTRINSQISASMIQAVCRAEAGRHVEGTLARSQDTCARRDCWRPFVSAGRPAVWRERVERDPLARPGVHTGRRPAEGSGRRPALGTH